MLLVTSQQHRGASMKRFLAHITTFVAGMVISALLLYGWSYASSHLPAPLRIQRMLAAEYNDKATSVFARQLARDFLHPYTGSEPDTEPILEFGNDLTIAKTKRAIESLERCGYDARMIAMPAEGEKKFIIVTSKDLPSDALIFKDAWMWSLPPSWSHQSYRAPKDGRRRPNE
jgi:hypothetical protein